MIHHLKGNLLYRVEDLGAGIIIIIFVRPNIVKVIG